MKQKMNKNVNKNANKNQKKTSNYHSYLLQMYKLMIQS
jgi:hypothetical protein